jgi:outer membrane lipopolysaccharide assembly protein LptE/RlpB
MKKFWLILPCLLLVLQACGFQLAGLGSLPENLSNLRLLADSLSTNQQRTLAQRLQRAGVTLYHDDEENPVTLRVAINSLPERKIADSVGSGQRIVRLSRQLVFTVTDATGERLADNKVIVQNIDLELDDANLLGTEGEKQQALDNLDTALFNSLMIQLRRL